VDWRDHAEQVLPGAVGALVALGWIGGGAKQLAASVLGGCGAAYYAAPLVAGWFTVSEGLSGFMLGLFGMAVASRVFEAIAAFPIARVVEWLLKRFGI
jgi:hypothetical protein